MHVLVEKVIFFSVCGHVRKRGCIIAKCGLILLSIQFCRVSSATMPKQSPPPKPGRNLGEPDNIEKLDDQNNILPIGQAR